jgi:RNA polymerase sigma factor (sigma-70 family)
MFYKPSSQNELSQFQMDRVRKGFTGLLWKVLHNSEFIANNADELIAIAHTEYVRAIDKGVEIEDPIGWTIHCAWRRTQNFLTLTNSRPRQISSERLAELIDETTPTPAQIAEDTDRTRKVRRAVANLDVEQRQLVALMYFEEMSLAEAARNLSWHESKARRCHKTTLKKLHEFLGVKSSDELAVEIGLAAWLSFASAGPLDLLAGVEAALDKAGHEVNGLWVRAHDLARRFGFGGGSDAAGVAATSGAGRAVGVCATVAVACVVGASSVVGPGVRGGIELFSGHDRPRPAKAATNDQPASDSFSASSPESAIPPPAPKGSESATTSSTSGAHKAQAKAKKSEPLDRDPNEVGARVLAESEATESSSSPSASASARPAAAESASGHPAPSSSSSDTAQSAQQFGAFK